MKKSTFPGGTLSVIAGPSTLAPNQSTYAITHRTLRLACGSFVIFAIILTAVNCNSQFGLHPT
ncbi:hypothetical protein LPE01_22860 [Lactiplantibacillus pentosus]|nr:hypothetical protein LPE01_22860 [Lactiplantibacillus pentosus]